jgi:hypothetical protein
MPNPTDQGKQINCDEHPQVLITVTKQKTVKPGATSRLSISDIQCKHYSFDWGTNKGVCTYEGAKSSCCYV